MKKLGVLKWVLIQWCSLATTLQITRTLWRRKWMGALWPRNDDSYASDITRTVFLARKIHAIKKSTTLNTAIQAVKPGMKASEIDKIARDTITESWIRWILHSQTWTTNRSKRSWVPFNYGRKLWSVEHVLLCWASELFIFRGLRRTYRRLPSRYNDGINSSLQYDF